MNSAVLAAFYAPLGAVSRRNPALLHAATMEAILAAALRKPKRLIVGVCGKTGLVLPSTETEAGSFSVILWPPAVKAIAPNVRCRACWIATGRQKPRRPKVKP